MFMLLLYVCVFRIAEMDDAIHNVAAATYLLAFIDKWSIMLSPRSFM